MFCPKERIVQDKYDVTLDYTLVSDITQGSHNNDNNKNLGIPWFHPHHH